ncbi:ribosome silencing factor [Parasporobacterium paucivorans]|uniref:Ribosomal silencing factor RsfS n=1 Tax=Parasporobacterium paucivorans DSM 15970 TaxID=1122934 RepID=A0A1M6A4M0_9FIRM|nr:ribosome silencing factor [Parasporobacterium paucivorans]SHI31406.1 ribosome-associated protein [Parasporobacterium paucivorans DSM 15970]
MTTNEVVKTAYKALDDKKAVDIKVLSIAEVSVIADYFIIAGGENKNQVQALFENVEGELRKNGVSPKHVEGNNNSNWILMDYGDVIIHIFNQEDRLFYDLERIWKDGKSISIEEM